MLAAPSLGKPPIQSAKSEIIKALQMSKQRIFIKIHSIESRFVIGPSNTLFACVYVSTFQSENLAAGAVKGLGTGAQDGHLDFHTAPGL